MEDCLFLPFSSVKMSKYLHGWPTFTCVAVRLAACIFPPDSVLTRTDKIKKKKKKIKKKKNAIIMT